MLELWMDQMKFSDIKGLAWRERNAAIEAALRVYLGSQPAGLTFESFALAQALDPDGSREDHGALSKIMVRLAPYLPGLASHDGAAIARYGKSWRRWQWHGQGTPVVVSQAPDGPVCVFCDDPLTTSREKIKHYHDACRAKDILDGEQKPMED